MSRLRRSLYRGGSFLGDVEALTRGPGPAAKRVVRRTVYRHAGRGLRRLLRGFGGTQPEGDQP